MNAKTTSPMEMWILKPETNVERVWNIFRLALPPHTLLNRYSGQEGAKTTDERRKTENFLPELEGTGKGRILIRFRLFKRKTLKEGGYFQP